MIVRAIDGRYLGHPLFFSIEKEWPWQRMSPASKFMQSSCQGVRIQKLKHEMVTGKQNCKLFSSAGLHSQKSVELRWPLCRGPTLSASGSGALRPSLCRPALSVFLIPPAPMHVPHPASGPTGPHATPYPVSRRATHLGTGQLRSACHPSSPARSLFPRENPKPRCLGHK